MNHTLANRIEALLPQTQCRRCGYDGCRPYAEAVAADEADIDQCPPGGEDTVIMLAGLLGRAPKPLNTAYGEHKPPLRAIIDEQACIGCTKCIQACPVDAILGAPKLMHTVIAAECTGCELCIRPCPVDCIEMAIDTRGFDKDKARQRYRSRNVRLAREAREKRQRRTGARADLANPAGLTPDERKAVIRAAIARAKSRRRESGR